MALFYPPYQYETIHAVFTVNGETLKAKETIVIEPGFKKITGKHDDSPKLNLSQLVKGQSLSVKASVSEQKLTEPPLRLSEADILAKMEKFGLGTPATRAEIIERIIETEVVERQNGRLYPSRKGKQLYELVNEELKSPELTARWEKDLELIARGKGDAKQFLQKIRQQTKDLVSEIKTTDRTYRAHNLTGSKCPECGSFLKERSTKEGKILVCSNMECCYRKHKDAKLSNRRCPQCHKKWSCMKEKLVSIFNVDLVMLLKKQKDVKKLLTSEKKGNLFKNTQKLNHLETA